MTKNLEFVPLLNKHSHGGMPWEGKQGSLAI